VPNCSRLIGIGAGAISAIDYIFVSKAVLKRVIAFDIGVYEDWCLSGLSDHAQLIAE